MMAKAAVEKTGCSFIVLNSFIEELSKRMKSSSILLGL